MGFLGRHIVWGPVTMGLLVELCAAQSFDIGYFAPTLVGSGARATAMGSAGVAAVNDGMAAAVNPAALTRIAGSQALVAGRFTFGSFSAQPRSPLPQDVSLESSLGSDLTPEFVGVVFPLSASGRRVIGALAVTNILDLGRSTLFRWIVGREYPIRNYRDIEQTLNGGLYALTAAVGAELNTRTSVGLTVHFLSGRQKVEWTERTATEGVETVQKSWRQENKFSGLALEIGSTARVGKSLDLGLKLSLPHTLTFVHPSFTASARDSVLNDLNLKVPLFFALGTSFRPWARMCIALDFRWAPWSEAAFDTVGWVPRLRLPDAHSVHVGFEYLFPIREWLLPVRLGFHTDPRAEYQFAAQEPEHWGDPISGIALCGGLGVQSSLVSFDLSVDFGLSSYTGRNVFAEVPEGWKIKEQRIKVVFAAMVRVQ
ncbi:MAG: hypothetical protein ONB15_04070 [candidate division KSB1 bacterium]|nr:hypothetical protein [candidate division KSB1 bacterium]